MADGAGLWGWVMRSWIVIIVGLGALVFVLNALAPDQLASDYSRQRLVGLLIVLAISTRVILQRGRIGPTALQLAIWVGLGLVLVLGYSFRDEIGARLRGELVPSALRPVENGEFVIGAADDGHFYVDATVGESPVRFMIDTGASEIVLPAAVAARLGFAPESLNYSHPVSTANGLTWSAPVTLGRLTVGPKTLTDVTAYVNQGELDTPLLGMRFLRSLRAFRVQDDRFFLTF